MTPRASLCPAISRSTTRRNLSRSLSLMLPSIAASPFAPPRGPPGLPLARSCRSSHQLPQAVRAGQCITKEVFCPEPRKPPKLVLDAEARQYATTQGHDARPHKQREIVQCPRSNAAHHQAALHCGQSVRATSTAAAISPSSARSSAYPSENRTRCSSQGSWWKYSGRLESSSLMAGRSCAEFTAPPSPCREPLRAPPIQPCPLGRACV